jgi:cobalt-zinc-cadmium efflux system membrane fusion protein
MKTEMLRTGKERQSGAGPLWIFALVLLAAACSPGGQKPATSGTNLTLTQEQRQHIHVYTVVPARFHKTVVTNGTVDFDQDQSTSVISPITGPVTRLLVGLGDKVRKDTPLASVASSDFASAISSYRKAIATADTARRIANLDKDLVSHHSVSAREAEQAETDAVNAESDRDAALQALNSLGVDPETIKAVQQGRPVSRIEAMIRSPITGTVVQKLITPGQLLQAGSTACFAVADLSRVWVMAQVFGSDLTNVAVGDTAAITTGIDGHAFTGHVDNIAAVVDPDTRSVGVRIVVDNPGDLLKKQMYVRVAIQDRRESAGLLVPDSAILRDDENLPFVYLALRDGSFARRQVALGYRAGNRYEVTAGLRPGDRVVVDGALFLQFMQSQ